MRILRQAPFGVRDADVVEYGDGAFPRLVLRDGFVLAYDFHDLHADREHRVQRCHGLLKNHADLAAADLAHVFPRQCQQVAVLVEDLAGHDAAGRARNQPQHAERSDALARARLAHETEYLAAAHIEIDAVDGFRDAGFRVEVRPEAPN